MTRLPNRFESQARSEDLRGVQGLMFVHIPLPEVLQILKSQQVTCRIALYIARNLIRQCRLFAAALGLNVSGIFHGHNHNNDFLARVESTSRTIHVGYGRKSGYGGYGGVLADKPGARVIIMKLDEDWQDYTWSTYIRLENNSTAHETVRQSRLTVRSGYDIQGFCSGIA
ncbi:purple acid phosphatase [Perkinsus olseni]|uniref:Purple acid phosphatase n=1 Tax=Perkinsus olseni TaxID=32597 RepID=A0A7J6THL1_PEROL|nr:purple acid phosphatase [Perkinsus olseni]